MNWSIRWYYQDSVDRWGKLEAREKIGPRQKKYLEEWRKLKTAYPSMDHIEVNNIGGEVYISPCGLNTEDFNRYDKGIL